MREIKFRAWCEGTHLGMTFNESFMDYDVFLSRKGNYLDVEGGWDIHGEYPTVPIMQYTGLKDKNGKEIYEGDIVKKIGTPLVKVFTGVVKYESVGFTTVDFNLPFDNDCVLDYQSKVIEVIGNIHENK